ncbi:MBL fold metallo-hydrolase [Halieaceae bacterium IMCC14734]|uniref:MBL fold metallo-hydrolase n=1 Tax=Candidatus Litorirhabdus singularis TaxID=2518993 RepID=A0ABT3TFU6_9GAMM|nr:MBL fold metallo-hydrolase [Candidatus Litorirhabdus singularis]MCX2980294.1 MBL fold metallo-hydrolase [Candidatus Litorirhabdus singularis]
MNGLLRTLTFILVLLVALPAAILLPAHWQIRQLETPPLPAMNVLLAAIETNLGPTSIHYLNTASQTGPDGTIDHPGILLRWESGKTLLIDTGMPPAQAIAFGKPMESLLKAQPTQTFGAMDEQLGDAANAITGIVFTHLHSDHTDGLAGICAAQSAPATVYQTPIQSTQSNYTTGSGVDAIARANCTQTTLDDALLMPLPGFPGVLALAAGGHTPGSTIYFAKVAERVWVMAGDISNDKHSIIADQPKPWIYSNFIVPENATRLGDLRRYLAQLDARPDFAVVIQHDVQAMRDSGMAAWKP